MKPIKVKGQVLTDADFRDHLSDEQYSIAKKDPHMRGALAYMVLDAKDALKECGINSVQSLKKIQ